MSIDLSNISIAELETLLQQRKIEEDKFTFGDAIIADLKWIFDRDPEKKSQFAPRIETLVDDIFRLSMDMDNFERSNRNEQSNEESTTGHRA
jgi:hypothetical protein